MRRKGNLLLFTNNTFHNVFNTRQIIYDII